MNPFERFALDVGHALSSWGGRNGSVHVDANVRRAFVTFDKDGDGSLTLPELKDALDFLGVPANRARELMQRFDSDSNSTLEVEEFQKLYDLLQHEAAAAEVVANIKGRPAAAPKMPEAKPAKVVKSKIKAVFDQYDKDHDGHLTVPELKDALTSMMGGASEKATKKLLMRFDHDENRQLELNEFQSLVNELEMFDIFSEFDADGDGHMTVAELKLALKHMGFSKNSAQTEAVLASFDQNANRTLELPEFATFVQALKDAEAETS